MCDMSSLHRQTDQRVCGCRCHWEDLGDCTRHIHLLLEPLLFGFLSGDSCLQSQEWLKRICCRLLGESLTLLPLEAVVEHVEEVVVVVIVVVVVVVVEVVEAMVVDIVDGIVDASVESLSIKSSNI